MTNHPTTRQWSPAKEERRQGRGINGEGETTARNSAHADRPTKDAALKAKNYFLGSSTRLKKKS